MGEVSFNDVLILQDVSIGGFMFSKWLKVDFHIHSDKSNETKRGDYKCTFDCNTLLAKLRDYSIDMFSLTDHNIVNVEAYRMLYKECLPMKLFVGIEFDIAIDFDHILDYVDCYKRSVSRKNKSYHALLLFESEDYLSISSKVEGMYSSIASELKEKSVEIDFDVDKQARITTMEHIFDSMNEDFVIIAHGNKDKSGISVYSSENASDEFSYSVLLGDVSALEMKSSIKKRNAIDYINKQLERYQAKESCKSVSFVCFSDNHNCDDYKLPEQVTWIKGSKCFDTLRLAFTDPESRVHMSSNPPTHVPDYITSVKMPISDQPLQTIQFSPYLNVIIGGRSSGKSLLFNSMIEMFSDVPIEKKNNFRRSYKNIVPIDKASINKLSIGRDATEVASSSDIFCQEDIIRLFDDMGSLSSNFEGSFERHDDIAVRRIESEIENVIADLKKAYGDLYNVNKSRKDLQNLKNPLLNSIKPTNQLFIINEFELPSLNEKQADKLLDEVKSIRVSAVKIVNAATFGQSLFSQAEKEQINDFLKLIDEKILWIEHRKKDVLVKKSYFERVKNLYQDYIVDCLDQEKREVEGAKSDLSERLQGLKEYYKCLLSLRRVCRRMTEINTAIEDRSTEFDKYRFVSKVALVNPSEEIKNLLADRVHEYRIDLDVSENLAYLSNQNSSMRLKNVPLERGKLPEELFRRIEEKLNSKPTEFNYEIIEISDDHSITTSTASTSQGKKASMFLDVKFKQFMTKRDVKLIMIDQPEDNLDNSYMSKSLIPLIRKLKKRIQIVFVTHNPSIAVYGDAENVIIADNNNGIITYKQGGLENIEIRKEACLILDGGEEAFKNRMDKYSISNIRDVEE